MISVHHRTADLPATAGRPLAELVPVFLRWFALIRRRSENTVRAYQADLAAFLAFCEQAGLAYPADVRVQHIEVFMGVLIEHRDLDPASVNRHLSALRSFWRWLQRERLTTENPPALAFALKVPKRLPKYLPIPQQDRLFHALSLDHSPTGVRDYALHATLGLGGLRCAEVSTLRLTDLDLETGVMRVIGKGDKAREVPVVPVLASVLSRYLSEARPVLLHSRESDYVFVRTGPWAYTSRANQPLGPKAVFYLVRKTLHRILGIEQGQRTCCAIPSRAVSVSTAARCKTFRKRWGTPNSPRRPAMPTWLRRVSGGE